MLVRTTKYVAWLMLALAIAAWAGVGLLEWAIVRDRTAFAEGRLAAREQALQYETAARTHAMVQGTERERARLESMAQVGVVGAADIIEEAGKISGVRITIGGATPENALVKAPGIPVQGVGFAVNGEGNFSTLVRALQLFEALPLPSVVRRYELERSGSSSKSAWIMRAYIVTLTTAESTI